MVILKAIRVILVIACVIFFLQQVYQSWHKLCHPQIITSSVSEYRDTILSPLIRYKHYYNPAKHFPGIKNYSQEEIANPFNWTLDNYPAPSTYFPIIAQGKLNTAIRESDNLADPRNFPRSGLQFEDVWEQKLSVGAFFYAFKPQERYMSTKKQISLYLRPADIQGTNYLDIIPRDMDLGVTSAVRLFDVHYEQLPQKTVNSTDKTKQVILELKNVEVKRFPSMSFPCQEDSEETAKSCMEKYFVQKMQCRLRWYKEEDFTNVRVCNTQADWEAFQNISLGMYGLNETQLMNMWLKDVNCPITCNRVQHKLHKVVEADVPCRHDLAKDCTDLLQIIIWSTMGETEVREETLMYDWNNFIADVGGLLGLLLGASILSIFDGSVHAMISMVEAIEKQKKKGTL